MTSNLLKGPTPLKTGVQVARFLQGVSQPLLGLPPFSVEAWRFCAWYVWRGSCASCGWCASFPSCAWLSLGILIHSQTSGVQSMHGILRYIDPYLRGHFLWFKCIPGSPVNCVSKKKPVPWGFVQLKHEKRNDGRIPGKNCQNLQVLESQLYGIDGIDVIPWVSQEVSKRPVNGL